MSDQTPDPPTELSETTVDQLDDCSADELRKVAEYVRSVADYADTLAAYREREEWLGSDEDADEATDRPDDVPAKASTTIKEINDNRYYYWQWRDGDSVRSQYKGPVDDAE